MTIAGRPMRAPTMLPAPRFDGEKSIFESHATFGGATPPSSPRPEPHGLVERRVTGSPWPRLKKPGEKFMYEAVTQPSGPSTSMPSERRSAWYFHVPGAGSQDQRGACEAACLLVAMRPLYHSCP